MSSFARSVTIEIFNASGADIIVNYGALTGGEWETPPRPGSVISPTQQQSYVNGAANNFIALGGEILLTPASGGAMTPTWSWPSGGPVSGSVDNMATDLSVTHQFINIQTDAPTMQVIIANAAAGAKRVAEAKGG